MSIYRFLQGVALVAVASLALFVASGCGGSDSGASAVTVETGSLSKAAFISKADSLCKATRSKLLSEYTEYVKEANPTSSAEETEALEGLAEDVVLPDYEEMLGEIGQLGAPSADAKKVSAIIDAFERRLDEIERKPAELTATSTPFEKVAKLAVAYGLKGCAESLG